MSHGFATRPALRTRMSVTARSLWQLRATVVFHPQRKRIGAFSVLASGCNGRRRRQSDVVVIGRLAPQFSDGLALDEPHVSRQALRITLSAKKGDMSDANASLEALADARVGSEASATLLADYDDLTSGLPVRLGHGVVVLVRLVLNVEELPGYERDTTIIGASYESSKLRAAVAATALTELPVMLLGEAGTGKEVVASAIHEASSRRDGPFIPVNAAAVNEHLSAAEFFGASRGGFTGATNRLGFFQKAHQGSLFLDEVADIPASVQPQLLRALESGELQVVGGAIAHCDVRVISATDGSVDSSAGFRNALRSRLAGHTLRLSPLRERKEDIGGQALKFIDEISGECQLRPIAKAESCAQTAAHWGRFFFGALSAHWPANSRTLRQRVIRAALGDPAIAPEFTRSYLPETVGRTTESLTLTDEDVARIHRENAYSVPDAAHELHVSRTTAYRILEENPLVVLPGELSRQEVEQAVSQHADLNAAAFTLRVSLPGLRHRMRQLGVSATPAGS